MGLWDWFIQKPKKKRKFSNEEYKKLVNEVIKKSFPSLKNKPLIIKELNNSRYTAKTVCIRNKIIIKISPRMDTYLVKLNKGVLAHELSHMEDWCSMGWFNFYILRDLKMCFDKYIKEEEIRADKIMIQKGYGKSLYLQRKHRFKSKNSKDVKIRKNYWSPDEIKSYAQSIGMKIVR